MSNTRNVLMIALLSAGILAALTGTGLSIVSTVFAEDECNDNRDFNCNEEAQKVHQENNCKIVNQNENEDKSDNNENQGNTNGDINCWSFAQNPQDGDAIVDEFPPGPP